MKRKIFSFLIIFTLLVSVVWANIPSKVLYSNNQTIQFQTKSIPERQILSQSTSKSSASKVNIKNVNYVNKPECISDNGQVVITLQPNNQYMTVNGVSQEIDPGRGTKPVIIPKWGRTVVPIRAIVEALGGTIRWEGIEKKVTINLKEIVIELWIDNPQAEVNGIAEWIDSNNHDVRPIIVNSRTMLPLRFVAESLGCIVNWDAATRTITITYQSPESETSASKVITPEKGGTIELPDGAEVIIPQRAVDQKSTISIKTVEKDPLQDKSIIGKVYDISLKKGSLKDKAIIKLPLPTGYKGKDVAISYWDEQEKLWIVEGGKKTNGYLVLNVNHFSKRGVIALKDADTGFSVKNNAWHFINDDTFRKGGACYGMCVTASLAFKQGISLPTCTNPYCLPDEWQNKIKKAQGKLSSISFPQTNNKKFSVLQRELCEKNNPCLVNVLYPHKQFFRILPASHVLLAYSIKKTSTDEWSLNVYDPDEPCSPQKIVIKENAKANGSIEYSFEKYNKEATITAIRGLTDVINLDGISSSSTNNCIPNIEVMLSKPLTGEIEIGKKYEFYINIINNSDIRREWFFVLVYLPTDYVEVTDISDGGEMDKANNRILWSPDKKIYIPENKTKKLSFKIKFNKKPNQDLLAAAYLVNIYEYYSQCSTCDNEQKERSIAFYIYKRNLPDLIVDDISWTPSSPKEGDTVTFKATIKNIGEGDASSFKVKIYIDESEFDTETVSSLSHNSTKTLSFSRKWTATSECKDVEVVADTANQIEESNENNNTKTEKLCGIEENLNIDIWVDKGCGSTYKIGDHIKIYGKANVTTDATYVVQRPDGTWTHTKHLTANQTILLAEGDLSGPTGQRTYTLRVTYNGKTKEDSCSINVVQGESQFTVDIWVDKGCGSTYCSNDPIRIYFKSTRSGTATITDKTPDGGSNTFGPWDIIAGKTHYIDAEITPPTGSETLVLRVVDSSGNSATDQCTFIVQDCSGGNCQISMQPPQNMEGKGCCYVPQHTYDLGTKYDIQELYIKWKTGWCTGCDGPTTFLISHDLEEWRSIGTAHGIGHQWTEIVFHNLTAVRYIRISCPTTYVDDSYICVKGAVPSTNTEILKPNIYLYPPKDSLIKVRLIPEHSITKSNPRYPNGGWIVNVTPDGKIENRYNYLFYEGDIPYIWGDIKSGWIIKREDFSQKMPQILAKIGLNKREIRDFVDYWSVNLPDSKYYLFSPLDESLIDKAIELNITPKPDVIRRIWFGVVLLDKPINIPGPSVEPVTRKGFTVVEWGLCFIKKRFIENNSEKFYMIYAYGSSKPIDKSMSLFKLSFRNQYVRDEQRQKQKNLSDPLKKECYKPINFDMLSQIQEYLYKLKLFNHKSVKSDLIVNCVLPLKHLFSRT